MKTLKECVIEQKCRKGPAEGTTRSGAFWMACKPIHIRRYGGNGVGNGAADCSNHLELRHYRNGDVKAVVHGHYWHQNGAGPDDYMSVPALLDCSTVEQVIVVLKGEQMPGGNSVYSDRLESDLKEALVALGLEETEPAPDEVVAE